MAMQGNDFKTLDRSVRVQKIMDTASRVFLDKGYHAASLDNVAAELGVTKAALYYYFTSKEDLLAAIYIQAIETALERGMEVVDLDLPLPEKLSLFITRHIRRTIIPNISAVSVFLSEERQLSPKNQKKIRQGKKAYNNLFEGLIKEGMEQGYFRKGDAAFQANAILGMCNSVHHWYVAMNHPGGADEIAAKFVRLLEAGYLQTEPGPDDCSAEASPGGPERDSDWREELRLEQERHQKAVEEIMKRH